VARLLAVPVGLALVVGWMTRTRPSRGYQAGRLEANIAAFAEGKYDLRVDPRDVVLLESRGSGRRLALLLGRAPKGRPDPGGGLFAEDEQAGAGVPGAGGDQPGAAGDEDPEAAGDDGQDGGAAAAAAAPGAAGQPAGARAAAAQAPAAPPMATVEATAAAPEQAGHFPTRDVYFMDVRVSGRGIPLSARLLTNLSRTRSADETLLTVRGQRAAYARQVQGAYEGITVLDYAGEDPKLTADWGRLGQLQNGITNLQETGRWKGAGQRVIHFQRPSAQLKLSWTDATHLSIDTGSPKDRLVYDAAADTLAGPEALAELKRIGKGKRELLQWAVDTVRNTSIVGPRKIEWLEYKVFGLIDLYKRQRSRVQSQESTARDIAQEMAVAPTPAPGSVKTIGHIDPAQAAAATWQSRGYHWPPEKLTPIVKRPIAGEGEWVIPGDEFVTQPRGRPPLFAQTFLRPDAAREGFSRVYIIAWDPRQLSLDMVAGTREPLSATGALGSGMIPRDKNTVDNVVAAFNGGFQALHGEFGMMERGTVYLEPKPYAATIASLENGDTGFGTWGPDTQHIPSELRSYRQNLTPLVEDGVANPFKRGWWGGAPPGAPSPTHTIRTGLCLTREGYLAYFWGTSLDQHGLARAMNATRCDYGVHLDMNAGHAGFEFFKVQPNGQARGITPERNFKIAEKVPGRGDLTFYCRRLVRGMGLMHFPRYIKRDPRDFMYLALRKVLPGDDLTPLADTPAGKGQKRDAAEGRWIIDGLPQGGQPFPPAMARTFLLETAPGIGDTRVAMLKLDVTKWELRIAAPGHDGAPPAAESVPRELKSGQANAQPADGTPEADVAATQNRMLPPVPAPMPAVLRVGLGAAPGAPGNGGKSPGLRIAGKNLAPLAAGTPVLAILKRPTLGGSHLAIGTWMQEIKPDEVISAQPGRALSHDLPPEFGVQPRRYAAVGLDADGNLLYATATTADRGACARALGRAGAMKMMYIEDGKRGGWLQLAAVAAGAATAAPAAAGAGAWVALPGDTAPPLDGSVVLEARSDRRPAGLRLFPDVKPVSPNVWYALQAKRHRYFRAKDGGVVIRGVPGKKR
jgi:hypothetical protein